MKHPHPSHPQHSYIFWSIVLIALCIFVLLFLAPFFFSLTAKAETFVEPIFDPYVIYPTTGYGEAVAIGDFNGDSRNDVAVTTVATANKLMVFSQTAAHTLAGSDLGDIPFNTRSIVAGDFNNDGRTDLAYAGYISPTLFVRQQQNNGALATAIQYATAAGPSQLTTADFNLDTLQDIALTHSDSGNLGVFLQQNSGGFGAMTAYATSNYVRNEITTGDFDSDGRPDIVTLNGSLLQIFIQQSDGSFHATYSTTIGNAAAVAAGDITGDGRDDLAITVSANRPNAKLTIYAQTANGTFEPFTTYDSYDVPQAIRMADMDLDGLLDVVVQHTGWMKLGVYRQLPGGGLVAEELYDIPYVPNFGSHNLAIGDVNGDTLPDVVIAAFDRGLIVLPHKGPATPTPTASPTATLPPATATPIPSPTSVSSINNPFLYLGWQSSTLLAGVLASDEDIVAYESASNKWSIVFDGSVVKLSTANLNATQIDPDGSILFTLATTGTVPGIGEVTPADIVRFIPTSLGKLAATQGSYELVLDGSDVGLESFSTSGIHEGIDALARTPDGKLLISTAGSFDLPGVTGDDEDLIVFTASSLGANSAGSWSLYLDGSDVDLGELNEDLQNLWVDPSGNLFMMAEGATINGVLDDGDDIWACHPTSLGANSQCSWQRFWDADYPILQTKIVDSLDIAAAPPPLPTATPTLFVTKTPTAVPTNTPLPTATPMPSPTPAGGISLYINVEGSGSLGSITFSDEDILAQNMQTGEWSLIFDGSDVGIPSTGQIDAFEIETDGTILFSFATDTTLPTIGLVSFADIVRFVPTQLGNDTAGSFALYFDGSDVELTGTGENIDGIAHTTDGQLLISTSGSMFAGGVSGSDEDLLAFAPTSLGETTSGSFALYFDGSDVGFTLASEDTQGAWLAGNGDIYLSLEGTFGTPDGLSGDGNDIIICTPSSLGSRTACLFRTLWDGGSYGLANAVLGGFGIGAANLPTLQSSVSARSLDAVVAIPSTAVADEEESIINELPETVKTEDETPVDNPQGTEEIPDLKDVHTQSYIFLPLVNR